MLKWLLFFVIGFFTASIQCWDKRPEPMPSVIDDPYDDFRHYDDKDIMGLTYYLAKVEFEYTAINNKGEEVPTNREHRILMVATENGKIVGSAQSYCRHVNPPLEQIILLESTSWYYPLKSDGEILEDKGFNISQSCAPITYGCITLVHNYCSIFVDGLKDDKVTKPAILSKSSQKPAPGSKLIVAYDGDTFEVEVKNFYE